MALTSNWLASAVTRKVRTKAGMRFGRFAIAAALSLMASEIALMTSYALGVSAGWAAFLGWLAGAIVSYLLSRWAFKRKGRPNVLKETLPFWIISAMVIVVLTLATKFGSHMAAWMHLHGLERVLFVGVVYLLANCVTFVGRFVLFHYVLFADRGSAAAVVSAASVPPEDAFILTSGDPGAIAAPSTDDPAR